MLTQTEINALIAGASGAEDGVAHSGPRPAQAKSVKTYDFRRPDKFSKDQLRTLGSVHEAYGRLAGARLSQRLRFTGKPLSIALVDTAQMIFSEYLSGMTLPTQLVVLRSAQFGGDGKFLLDLDLSLAKAWIDRWLGGPGALPPEREEPTPIENAMIMRLIDELLSTWSEAWAQVAQLTLAPNYDTMFNSSMLRLVKPSDVVAVLGFEVRYEIGRTAETIGIPVSAPMSFCIPHSSLEPILPRLSATTWYESAKVIDDPSGRQDLTASLQNVEVPVKAVLGGVELTVDELASLKPGDVIRFGERADEPVRLSVMDQAMAWGVPGKVGDRVAIRLLTPLQQVMEA
jgi:flagellar motor switch protein FliM